MRFKLVPPPPDDVEVVRDVQRDVPLVPGSEADCCVRIMDTLDIGSRDVARTWLTFLRAIGLVGRSRRGFVRTGREPDRATLAAGLKAGVLGASELVDALDREPTTADEAFGSVERLIPPWERARDPNWEAIWRTRVDHLLGWLVLAGLAERVDGGYVTA